MNTSLVSFQPSTIQPQQAHNDAQLVALWLHGKSPHSRRAYGADVQRLHATVGQPLAEMMLADLQHFVDTLDHLSPNSRKRTINSIKSLFTFAHKLGYLRFNVGAALKAPKPKDELAERILTEQEIIEMIAHTKRPRDKLLLRLLYASAGRVSEICALCWKDVQPNGDGGQVTLYGKGDKTRTVKVSKGTWQALQAHRQNAPADVPVFVSQKGGHLDPSQVRRIVLAAAKRAGVEGNVSPHWLRHSHASHALDRGATVVLVRDTLGHSSLAITSRYTHAKPNESSALHLAV